MAELIEAHLAQPARVRVLTPLPLPDALDYSAETDLPPGSFVSVSVRGRETVGVVWDRQDQTPSGKSFKLKPVNQVYDLPPMPQPLRRLIDWVAAYTLSFPGDVLAMALRVDTMEPPSEIKLVWGDRPLPVAASMARKRVEQLCADQRPRAAKDIAAMAGVGIGIVRVLKNDGFLRETRMAVAPVAPKREDAAYSLSAEQAAVASRLVQAVAAKAFQPILLEGVTGSGKTETYLEAVAACFANGRQALILLPEIALSSQWMQRFRRRFGFDPDVWHSDLTPKTRRATWHGVLAGHVKVVVGARSALFLPFQDVGLIIVDEEHETSFKQEEGVIYHARDMAVVRAKMEAAPIVLVSATPSLETLLNAQRGRYDHLQLTERHGGAAMPDVQIVDMRLEKLDRGRFLAPDLVRQIHETIARGEQALLFLNRRGYAPLTLCRACGHRIHCPNCSAWLVSHRNRHALTCHHCGYTKPEPPSCPECGAASSLVSVGPGVERIAEEAADLFPAMRRMVMASDTITTPQQAEAAATSIVNGEIDLIIGTQIIAKGWHFPHLTLVGVVDADLGLAGGDLRAGERCVQLLHQVAGRAGREEAAGHVVLQSYSAEHPVMRAIANGDLAGFMAQESAMREPGHWPPFGRLAALILSSENAEAVDQFGQLLARTAPTIDGVMILGPAPAPLALLRGRHRRRFLLKAPKEIALQPILDRWLGAERPPRNIQIDVDIDPVSFM